MTYWKIDVFGVTKIINLYAKHKQNPLSVIMNRGFLWYNKIYAIK